MNNEKTERNAVCLNFSGAYLVQDFYRAKGLTLLDCEDISGTNCYCDDMAAEEIRKRIEKMDCNGIHFLDSGNYHYMTKFWLEKIKVPFSLLVFDNHTDLQPPAFGGILSCGGWIAASLEEITNLKRVILIGPDQGSYDLVDCELQKHIQYLSREELKNYTEEDFQTWMNKIELENPVYISIDKDILSEHQVKTNWSQGDLTVDRLLNMLDVFCNKCSELHLEIIGMDVCGEEENIQSQNTEKSNLINKKLLKFWSKL